MSGPARGRLRRANVLRAFLPCLALIAFDDTPAQAQTLTPDLLRPVRDGFVLPQNSPLRRTSDSTLDPADPASDDGFRKDKPAPSRIGNIPTYGLPAASGASGSGFDSLNRIRKKPKLYPGQARPKPPPGPGSPAPSAISNGRLRLSIPPSETANKTPIPPRDGRHGGRPAAAQAPEGRRRSVRRGRRLCRQLSRQVRGRALRRLRHQSRPHGS